MKCFLLVASWVCVLLVPLPTQAFVDAVTTSHPGLTAGSIGLADTNGDGNVDIVVAPNTDGVVRTLLGDGVGGFSMVVASPSLLGIPAPATAVLDVTADGRVDLVQGGGPSFGVQRMDGDGLGGFAPGIVVSGLGFQFAAMDVDRDGRPDLVGFGGGMVTVVRGMTAGGFAPAVGVPSPVPLPIGVLKFATADVDRDGNLDLLAGGLGSVVLHGDGVGGFPRGSALSPQAFAPLALADFDGDGFPDLLAQDVLGVVRLFPSNGVGGFLAPSVVFPGGSSQLRILRVADVDMDGRVDLLIRVGTTVQVHLGDGVGGFATVQSVAIGSFGDFQVGDLDGDGRVELVAVGSGQVHVARGASAPPGVAGFGTGTPACGGRIGLSGNRAPRFGTSGFRVQCTNAPRSATGLLLAGTKVVGGWDPLGIELRLHLGFLFPVGTMHSDPAGVASRPLALPSSLWFVGFPVHLQSVWMADAGSGDTCSPALYELASSRGLTITIQP
jgi:hypothetical protein